MIITGVNIIDNKIDKWKIENSWGSKTGNNGYYVATDNFINNYPMVFFYYFNLSNPFVSIFSSVTAFLIAIFTSEFIETE